MMPHATGVKYVLLLSILLLVLYTKVIVIFNINFNSITQTLFAQWHPQKDVYDSYFCMDIGKTT